MGKLTKSVKIRGKWINTVVEEKQLFFKGLAFKPLDFSGGTNLYHMEKVVVCL